MHEYGVPQDLYIAGFVCKNFSSENQKKASAATIADLFERPDFVFWLHLRWAGLATRRDIIWYFGLRCVLFDMTCDMTYHISYKIKSYLCL